MTTFDDFRRLADVDQTGRHRMLRFASDAALGRMKLDMQYDRNGNPIVGVGLVKETCPVDPDATYRIKYWLGDTTRRSLIAALTKSSLAVVAAMEGRGVGKIWGACPKNATHLVTFLDRVVAAGLCRRVDGATVDLEQDHGDFYFYIAERAQAKEFMQR